MGNLVIRPLPPAFGWQVGPPGPVAVARDIANDLRVQRSIATAPYLRPPGPLAPTPAELIAASFERRPPWAQTMIGLGASGPATDLGIAIGVDRTRLAPFPTRAPAPPPSQASFTWSNTIAGVQVLPFANLTGAQEHKDAAAKQWSGIASDAIIDGWLGGGYVDMVKHSKYPWWWGRVQGWPDISAALKRDIAVMEASRLPSGIKAIATANMNAAWIWAKEHWASGRGPVAI